MSLFRSYKVSDRDFRVTIAGILEENFRSMDQDEWHDNWREVPAVSLTETWEMLVDELSIRSRNEERERIILNFIKVITGR